MTSSVDFREPHAIASGGAVEVGVGAAVNFHLRFWLWPRITRAPPNSTSSTSFSSPGSKRTLVPAGIFRRMHARRVAIELQRVVHFVEVIVTAHLHRLAGLPRLF